MILWLSVSAAVLLVAFAAARMWHTGGSSSLGRPDRHHGDLPPDQTSV